MTAVMSGPAAVLVADDDASVRRLAAFALRRAGFDVIEAPTGQRALDVAQTGSVGLIVRLDELVARVGAHLRKQAAWSHMIEDELRTRASVVAALAHLPVSSVPEEAAEASGGSA